MSGSTPPLIFNSALEKHSARKLAGWTRGPTSHILESQDIRSIFFVSTTCVACSVASCCATENPSARRSMPENNPHLGGGNWCKCNMEGIDKPRLQILPHGGNAASDLTARSPAACFASRSASLDYRRRRRCVCLGAGWSCCWFLRDLQAAQSGQLHVEIAHFAGALAESGPAISAAFSDSDPSRARARAKLLEVGTYQCGNGAHSVREVLRKA